MEHPKDVEIFGFQTFYKLQLIHCLRNTPIYEVINGSKNGCFISGLCRSYCPISERCACGLVGHLKHLINL